MGLVPSHVRRSPTSTSSMPTPSCGRTRRGFPPIDGGRQLFAALQFPVVPGPAQPNGDFDTLKIEAADYDDGFAKIVHVTQPVSSNLLSEEPDGMHPQKDIGVRLAWDDEQLLIWQNRQMLADPATPGKRTDAPLGVFFYRVDVRENGRCRLAFTRPHAEQGGADARRRNRRSWPDGARDRRAGVSVEGQRRDRHGVLAAELLHAVRTGHRSCFPTVARRSWTRRARSPSPARIPDAHIPAKPPQTRDLYEPVLSDGAELKYGKEYEFRVRLGDLTGGGPIVGDDELNDAPATSSSLVFKRYVAPKRLTVTPDDPQDRTGRRLGPVPRGDVVHRRTAAAWISGASLHRARCRRRVSEAARRQEVASYGETCRPDDQRVPRGQLLRSRRRSACWWSSTSRHFSSTTLRRTPSANHTFGSIRPCGRSTPTSRRRSALQLEYRNANVIDFGNADRSRRPSALEGRHRRRRHHRAAKVARHPHQDLSRVLGQARADTSGLPRRGSMRSCTWLASRLSSSSVRTPRTRSTSSSRGWSPSSCRASICSPIRRR